MCACACRRAPICAFKNVIFCSATRSANCSSEFSAETRSAMNVLCGVDSVAAGFLDSMPSAERYGHIYDPQEASGLICELIPRGAHVLDVGCGNGSLASMIREHRGAVVVGI